NTWNIGVLLPLDSVQLIDVIEDFAQSEKGIVIYGRYQIDNWQRLGRKAFLLE
ncbi:hypothetical protein Leryth_009065, partial [Lithospermum erythrorhizon]